MLPIDITFLTVICVSILIINTIIPNNITTLYENISEEKISRPTDGFLQASTAIATPSPSTIYIGEVTLVTISITHPTTGTPLEGIRVGLDHGIALNKSVLVKLPSDQFTDTTGKVLFSMAVKASGNITIFIENETDADNAFVIVVKARKPMTISNDPSIDETKTFTVSAKSNGVLITDTMVTFTFNGQTWPTTTGIATITAPSVPALLSYLITTIADGYTSASGTIMILNVPKLTIIPPSGEVKGKQKFVVTIANDEESGVTGVKVTFNDADYYSGLNGACELTAPDVKQDSANYEIKATSTGYTDVTPLIITIYQTPDIPGFELLTLMIQKWLWAILISVFIIIIIFLCIGLRFKIKQKKRTVEKEKEEIKNIIHEVTAKKEEKKPDNKK